LLDAGYRFRFATLEEALRNIIDGKNVKSYLIFLTRYIFCAL